MIAYYGGTLEQHIYHETNGSDRQARVHDIVLREKFNGSLTYKVNSIHHQAAKELPESFTPIAWHKDGTVEAFEFELGLGLQFHPECMQCEWSTMLINNLLNN